MGPNHYLNACWHTVSSTFRYKLLKFKIFEIWIKMKQFSLTKMIWKHCIQNSANSISVAMCLIPVSVQQWCHRGRSTATHFSLYKLLIFHWSPLHSYQRRLYLVGFLLWPWECMGKTRRDLLSTRWVTLNIQWNLLFCLCLCVSVSVSVYQFIRNADALKHDETYIELISYISEIFKQLVYDLKIRS